MAAQVTDEGGRKSGDAVAIQEAKGVVLVDKVVDNAVRIAVQRTAPIERSGLGLGRSTLACLDIVGAALHGVVSGQHLRALVVSWQRLVTTYVEVEVVGLVHVIVDNLDVEAALGFAREVFKKSP